MKRDADAFGQISDLIEKRSAVTLIVQKRIAHG